MNAITIDLDGVRHYHAIHGLLDPTGDDPPLTRGVERFLSLCRDLGVRSTIFVVGKDLERADFAELIRRASEEGHEIASHSYAHAYDLSTQSPAQIGADLHRSIDEIRRVVGRKPVGFRAPGYNVSAPLLFALAKLGFLYDSSIMRSPPYFALRALAIARRRNSKSMFGDPRHFFMTPSSPVLELPITTFFGWPWIGTSIAFMPEMLARASVHGIVASPRVLELHAIDFCDHRDGFDHELVRNQPDLRVPWETKARRMRAVMEGLAKDARTLESIARVS